MNQKIKIGNGGVVTLTDKHYKTAGGEAKIYVLNGMVYKLYHDPDKKMLPLKKMSELATISNSQVVIPKDVIYDAQNGKPLGYTTSYVDNVEPLVKLFTRTFKTDKNVSYQMINELVKKIQLTVADVHTAQCLIVDLNELNILAGVTPSNITPWFIDTDSYCTPSFKATAVMDSIRDRKCSVLDAKGDLHYHPTVESDWFSFAIIAVNLYLNIHPFRGSNAKYGPKDKKEQMDAGLSLWHPGVRVPPCVNNFNVIPSRHLDYFKRVFLNGERGVPPLPDSSVPMLVPTQIITITGTDKIGVSEIISYGDPIMTVYPIMGMNYVATKSHIYCDKKEIGTHNAKKILLCSASDGTPIMAQQDNTDKIQFKELTKSEPVGTSTSANMFVRNNAIYTNSQGKLIENTFTAFGNKIIHRIKEVENLSISSATMYDGCVIQDLLGKMFLTLPYKSGSCFSKHIDQLDGYRIISAKSDKNITVVVGEKKGQYDRFIIVFDKRYEKCDIRKVEDIAYDTITFAVMDNGMCALLASPTELELFSTAFQCETLNNPPFDSTMKFFSMDNGLYFINGNSLHQIKRK